jgi:hypothetical protein
MERNVWVSPLITSQSTRRYLQQCRFAAIVFARVTANVKWIESTVTR